MKEKYITIPESLFKATHDVLAQLPYAKIKPLMDELIQNVKYVDDPENVDVETDAQTN